MMNGEPIYIINQHKSGAYFYISNTPQDAIIAQERKNRYKHAKRKPLQRPYERPKKHRTSRLRQKNKAYYISNTNTYFRTFRTRQGLKSRSRNKDRV